MQQDLIAKQTPINELETIMSIISHDLQEPLRMVICFTELLEKKCSDSLDADGHEYVRFANDGAKRMRLMLDDLREYTRVYTRGEEFVLTNTRQIIQNVVTSFQTQLKSRDAVITVQENMPNVMVDQNQLYQIFKQLIDNALKFCPRDTKPKIEVLAETQDSCIRILIRDNCIKIDQRYYQQIFQVFSTLHVKKEYSGTGMGLSICKRIVERHGGIIGVNNFLGGGNEFYFTIQKVHTS